MYRLGDKAKKYLPTTYNPDGLFERFVTATLQSRLPEDVIEDYEIITLTTQEMVDEYNTRDFGLNSIKS